MYSYTDVTYAQSWFQYKRFVTITNKLVVNNSAGVDKYAFLNLTKSISNSLKEIKIKTLKSNGNIIELDSSLIFKKEDNGNKFAAISYPIPGVEPRDTIYTFYTYSENLKKYEMMDFVNLYSDIPSLNTEYTVKSDPNLLVRYKQYNSFPEPKVISNDSLVYCVFKMEKIKALSENKNMCALCELPYLYYSLEKPDSKITTWKDVYNQQFNAVTQPILLDYEKSSYYRKWKRMVIGEAKDSTKYFKFELLHKDIQDNFQMQPANYDELIKSSGYFLKNQYFDPLSIRRLYRQLLEDLEIDYSAVFARSKRSGSIDPFYIRMGEYDHVFFAYDNGRGGLNLLYPNDEYYKFQINEIPTSIYDTEAVMVKPYLSEKVKKRDRFINYDLKLAEVDSVAVHKVKLPGMSNELNCLRQLYYCDVNLEEKKVLFKNRFSVGGGLSTDLRQFFDFLSKNKDVSDFYDALAEFEGNDSSFQLDSVTTRHLQTIQPFNYTINSEGKLKKGIDFLNEHTLSISLENLVQHIQVESETDTVDLNYYLDYGYTDYFSIILNFPCKIDLLNNDNNAVEFRNDFGEYFFEAKIGIGGNQLIIQSNYKITKDVIPKDKYGQLKELNKFLKEIKNKRFILKLDN
ncbi:hypothetical protein WJN01_02145 [Flavobacteriaceae bacterium SZ-1-7]|uniref:DUF3857 domain-containing protein n=1 Tax=Tamlana sedimenti TaxID=3134126 RepID=UPI003123AC52